MKPSARTHLTHLLLHAVLAAGAVLTLVPLLDMVSTAFKGQIYVLEVPPRLIPSAPTLQNFLDAWQSNSFSRYFANSLGVALATTLLSALTSALFAYPFARFEFAGKRVLFHAILLTMMIPSMMLIIPQFMLARALGLRNSLVGLALFYTAWRIPFNTFFLRGFFEQLPRELDEAVLMDGGGYLTIFTRIILPLSTPALATMAIFTFLFSWEEFVWALTAVDEPLKRTLPIAITAFQGQHATQWGLVFAASLIAVAPVIVVFAALQRYFVKGLMSGALKG